MRVLVALDCSDTRQSSSSVLYTAGNRVKGAQTPGSTGVALVTAGNRRAGRAVALGPGKAGPKI